MTESDLPVLHSELEQVKKALITGWQEGSASFFRLPDDIDAVRASKRMARDISKKARTLIVSGIGGSDLGARALISALATPEGASRVKFVGANTDPEELATIIKTTDLRKSALNIVSKSGGTMEPMASFLVLERLMIKSLGKRATGRIIATTGAKGDLHDLASEEGYPELEIPEAVGGRFSALTNVSLFPAEFAGVSGSRLLDGARAMRDDFEKKSADENGPLLFAGLMVEAARKRGQTVNVLMPYSAGLRDFAFWFRQLWAESLGKAENRAGKEIYAGLTPIAALGATDQHSQLQLYNEGPKDKVLTFIDVGTFRNDMKIPLAHKGIRSASKLGGYKMSDLIHAERLATARSLASHERPSGTIRIEKITPESVGALMMFFMIATAAAAEMLDVDAYDQPGVEEGKKLADEALKKARA